MIGETRAVIVRVGVGEWEIRVYDEGSPLRLPETYYAATRRGANRVARRELKKIERRREWREQRYEVRLEK